MLRPHSAYADCLACVTQMPSLNQLFMLIINVWVQLWIVYLTVQDHTSYFYSTISSRSYQLSLCHLLLFNSRSRVIGTYTADWFSHGFIEKMM